MLDVIQEAQESLASWHSEYEFVFDSLSDFYTKTDLLNIPHHTGLTLWLRVSIKEQDVPKYEIFRGQSLSMPVVTDSSFEDPDSNHDYTQQTVDYKIFFLEKKIGRQKRF